MIDACTVITRNRLAHARVLANSFLEQHPGRSVWVFVADDPDGEVDASKEPFEVLRHRDLGIADWDRERAVFSAGELLSAQKPRLLAHLLGERDKVVCIDADIRVYAPFDELVADLERTFVLLSPHVLAPIPRDGRQPSESTILRAGVINGGLVAARRGDATMELLHWWGDRLLSRGGEHPLRAPFRQRWLDFLPCFSDQVRMMRDPGYNVAYWNLATRPITREGATWLAGGRPLRCMHFSGFDPLAPEIFSRYEYRPMTPLVRELCDEYASAVLAEGHREVCVLPYAFDYLECGLELTASARMIVDEAINAGDVAPADVFEDGGRRLLAWLAEPWPVGTDPRMTRYLHGIYLIRDDLRAHFPRIDGPDAAAFVAWWREHGHLEYALPDVLRSGTPD